MKGSFRGVRVSWGFGVLGFWGLGFRGFGVLGFWGLGLGFGVLGFGVYLIRPFLEDRGNQQEALQVPNWR